MRAWTSATALLVTVMACSNQVSSCEQRATAAASWNALNNTAVLTFENNSNPIAPWVRAYEAFRTDFEGLVEGAPQAVDDEVANAQTVIDESNALLASNEAASAENRSRLSLLIAGLRERVGSLLRSMDAACE
jgi:hypothetical protein